MLSATPAEAAVVIDKIEKGNGNGNVIIHTNSSVPTNSTTYPYNYFNPGSLSYADRTKIQSSGKPKKNGDDPRILYESNTTSAIVIGQKAVALDYNIKNSKTQKASGIAIGDYSYAGGGLSIAIGPFSRTASIGSVALGTSARAEGFNSFAAMRQSAAIADYSTAIGSSSWANATASFAIGASATALGDRSFAIGSGTPRTVNGSQGYENRRSIYDGQNNTLAFGTDAFSIGTKAKTNGNRSFAIGTNAWSGGFKSENHKTINELGEVINPDTEKVANNAFALGTDTRANSNDTVAFSTNANATGDGSIAFGVNSNTTGTGAIAFGNASKALQANAISIGWNATSHAQKVISIGSHSNASKDGAMAIGDTANSSGNNSVAIGYSANVSNANATAVGTRANITHEGGTAIGFGAESKDNYATAIAYNSTASGKNSIAAGVNSTVSGTRAAALGYKNTVSGNDTFVLGSNVTVDTEGSVILGSDSTKATATKEDTATVGTLTYSGFAGYENVDAGDYVSVGNVTNARQIKFVAPGKIASDSTDAINGSQLYAVADTLVKTGFNITADHSGLEGDAKKEDNVKLGETVKYTSKDKNIITTVSDNVIDFTLNNDFTIGGPGKDGQPGKDGSIGVKGADGTVGVTLNGKDGSIGLTGPKGADGKPGASANIAVKDGAEGVDGTNGKDGLPGENGKTRIVYETKDKDGKTVTEQVATLNDGLIFSGNNEDVKNRQKLNTEVKVKGEGVDKTASENFKSASGNINVKANGTDTLEVQLAKAIDLTKDGSVTIGDTTVNNDGLTIKDGPSVTKGGIDAKGTKITNVKDGDVTATSKDAVNGSQLYQVQEVANAGWNLTANGKDKGNVKPGATVDLNNKDGNIIITKEGNNVTFGLKNNLTIGGKDGKDGQIGIAGKDGKDGVTIKGDGTITAGRDGKDGVDGSIGATGKDGASVVLNGKDGSIGLTGPKGADGKPGASANIAVKDGAEGVDGTNGKDGLPGENGKTRIVYETKDKDGKTVTEQVATLNDGLIFSGNNEDVKNRQKLNTEVKVKGEGVDKTASENFKSASGNINVKANGTDTLEVQLAKAIDLTKDGSVTIGDTTVNNDGLTIKDGPSVTKGGIDAKGTKITNVKDGDVTATSKDAVNGSQLYQVQEVANAGWNLTANGKDKGNVKPGATVDLNNKDGNIIITKEGNNVTFGLKNNLTIGGKDGKDGQIGIAGKDGKDGVTIKGDGTITAGRDGKDGVDGSIGATGKDGASVVLNGKDGSIGLTGPKGADGKPGASANIAVKDGAEGVDGTNGKDGLPGENGKTRIVYETKDKDGKTVTEQVATLNDGLIFSGNNEDVKNRQKLNTEVKVKGEGVDKTASENFKSASGNINVKANGTDTLEVQLAKAIDLTKDGSVTIGDTTVNNDGLTIKDGPSVTKGGIDAKGTKITNVKDGDVTATSKDAVNGSQLYQVQEVANAGWNLTANGKDKGNVKPGATVDLNNKDGNIIITKEGNNVTFGLKNNLTIGGKDGKDGQIGIAGKDGKDGVTIKGDGTITAGRDGKDGVDGSIGATGKDGASVVLNGKDGSIGLTGPKGADGKPGASANIAVKDGAEGVDGTNGKDGLPGENGKTRIVYETKDKDGKTVTEQVATLNDGLIFSGNNEDVKNRQKLNTEVKVKGEGVDKTASENFKSASGNINVKANGTDTLEVQLAKAIDLTKDGSVTIGDTTVNNDGLTIKDGPSVTKGGIDAKGTKITNVKDGDVTATSKDAVSGSQLYNAMQNTGWYLTVDGNVAETSEKGAQRVNNNGKVAVSGGKNIVVSRKGSTVEVATSSNSEFDSVKVGGTTISSTVAKDGVNELNIAGSKNAQTRITNVAPGVKGTDAVNVSQLKGAENRLNNRISNVDKDLRAGIAGALAAGNLYHVTQPGKSMVSAGVGAYRGQGAIAVGYSRLSDNGKVGIKFSVNSNSRGDTGAAASVGYQW
ncbi:Hep_Hag [Mannheimia haemolytica]|uniref:Hep_Hag n=1 Tax=Mannheimia haemolytica TaxID=75985 RepID=A0A378MUS5_MANHA|nr:Hep_Hag [Mannheimia haemolytica]